MAHRLDYKAVDVPKLLTLLGITATYNGGNWLANCPNHRESSPSWSIKDEPGKPSNGIHYCFGCGFKGTAVTLAAHMIGLTSLAIASEWVATHALGQPIPALAVELKTSSLFTNPFSVPRSVCFDPLSEWPSYPKTYILSRITHFQVEKWNIGYCIEGRLRGRIVIPIKDDRSRIIAYTARAYNDSPKRYLEPHKDERPSLSAVFGEQDWPEPKFRDTLVITEGAFNALAIERTNPILPIAAIQGSSLTPGQIAKISTFKRFTILTDNDYAGDKAATHLEATLTRHGKTERLIPPKGTDPDILSRGDLEKLLQKSRFLR